MCGFIGCLYLDNSKENRISDDVFNEMGNYIHHRGPDDTGYYSDEHIQLGFKRLSIIDLSLGHQPLSYDNGRYWIVFNGEIYNYQELREDLQKDGYQFSTQSDTEVILALYKQVGNKAASKLRGMFAFLIWDTEEKTLYGARDPFGIKPLYLTEQEGRMLFASEQKAFQPVTRQNLYDGPSIQHYFSFQYIPEPRTAFSSIEKVNPGTYFVKKVNEEIQWTEYWHPKFTNKVSSLLLEEKLTQEVQEVLFDSVRMHMRSDVPVGCFLSGGIDSSFITTIASKINPNIKTFSVGFDHNGYSEVDIAKETALSLGVENYHHIITPDEFVKELPKIVWHMDDPLADPAAVPLYFVSKEAKKHVKVVLSGEGADELFGGYNIYKEPQDLERISDLPSSWKKMLFTLSKAIPEGVRGKSLLERGCTTLEERYIGNAKIFEHDKVSSFFKWYQEDTHYSQVVSPIYQKALGYHPVNKMQYVDMHTWLRGDILLKADKMTMAHSLELRVPFLDTTVFQVASQVPVELKIANGTTKYLLRRAAEGIVPPHVIQRKKLGFPVPIRLWLKNELYDWTETLIHESDTSHLLHIEVILDLLKQHKLGKKDNSRKIWTILMFMLWHQVFVEKKFDFPGVKQHSQ